jgi:hypothetical protein
VVALRVQIKVLKKSCTVAALSSSYAVRSLDANTLGQV